MDRRLYAGTLALVLAAGVGYAAAEDAIPGQGSSQERFNLNRQQEQSIMKGLHDEQAQSNSLDGMIIRDSTYLALLAYLREKFEVI